MIIPGEFEPLYAVLLIFKSMINIFECTSTPFWSAFPVLEKAYYALLEHGRAGNPFGAILARSLWSYTIGSIDSGIWILGYLLTPKGRDDFHERLRLNKMHDDNPEGYIQFFQIKKGPQRDPIDHMLEEFSMTSIETILEAEDS
jgi:hypothetical protein